MMSSHHASVSPTAGILTGSLTDFRHAFRLLWKSPRITATTLVTLALCIGATAVCVGRPYIWGLGAFGQPGVERVLELQRVELYAIMQQLGAPSIKQLNPAMVRRV